MKLILIIIFSVLFGSALAQEILEIKPRGSSVLIIAKDTLEVKNIGFPILKEKPIRGIYMNHQEFLYNKPRTVENFKVVKEKRFHKSWKGTYSFYPVKIKRSRKIRCWGFFDGNNFYVNHLDEYFPIEIIDSEFFFYAYGIPNYDFANVAAYTGTLLGGAVSIAATESAINKAKNQRVYYQFDPGTGRAKPKKLISEDGTVEH
ncbi:MAG: DUF6563 family protein [Cyclobacteriaceae bacterium]